MKIEKGYFSKIQTGFWMAVLANDNWIFVQGHRKNWEVSIFDRKIKKSKSIKTFSLLQEALNFGNKVRSDLV